jgi:hypothetical protein
MMNVVGFRKKRHSPDRNNISVFGCRESGKAHERVSGKSCSDGDLEEVPPERKSFSIPLF